MKKGRKLLSEKPLVKIAIAIPEQTYNVLQKEASSQIISVSQIIRSILIKYANQK